MPAPSGKDAGPKVWLCHIEIRGRRLAVIGARRFGCNVCGRRTSGSGVRAAGGSPRTVRAMTTADTIRARALAALATVGVAALVAACGASSPKRNGTGTIEKSGSTSLLKLRVGDCVSSLRKGIDDPDAGHNGIFKVEAVPCTAPHDGEVLRISGLGGGAWPGWSIVDGEAARGRVALQERLSRVTRGAKANADGQLSLFTFRPSQERWEFEGQRTIVFLVLYAQPRRGAVEPAATR
jgi:hypothetical protein